ncbi:MAG: heavy metal translocating P-type ATPase, partial [Eubacteriales bacterium]
VQHLKSALIFLVVSCPCALVISVPLSFFCGIGCASKNGILVKGATFMEGLAQLDTMIFDKTGTLTEGRFELVEEVCAPGADRDTLLFYAAKAEYFSDHPIAAALKQAYPGLNGDGVADASQIIGKGVRANVNGRQVYVGNLALMQQCGLSPAVSERAETALHVALDGVYAGVLYVADRPKPDAASALTKLKQNGIRKTVMLTGDKASVAQAIAAQLGIDEVHSELLPDDKVRLAEQILTQKASKKLTAYVGDGINDAPVLSRADVGIAMGGMGSDAAIEAADVVLMDDKPSKLPLAIAIARKTMRIVSQNIVFAIGIKVAVMVFSALGYGNMWVAIFADVGVSVLAILNALRTFRIGQRFQ